MSVLHIYVVPGLRPHTDVITSCSNSSLLPPLLLLVVRLWPLWPPVSSRQRPNALLASPAPPGLGLAPPPPLKLPRLQTPQQHRACSCSTAGALITLKTSQKRGWDQSFCLVQVFLPTAGVACFVFLQSKRQSNISQQHSSVVSYACVIQPSMMKAFNISELWHMPAGVYAINTTIKHNTLELCCIERII